MLERHICKTAVSTMIVHHGVQVVVAHVQRSPCRGSLVSGSGTEAILRWL